MALYSVYSLFTRATNNVLAPIRVSIDKFGDVINYNMTNDIATPQSKLKDGEKQTNVDGVDEIIEPRKIVRMNPRKSIFEDYFHFCKYPTEVYPNLYLGSAYNAACYYTLSELGIKYVVNVSLEISNYYSNDMTYYRIPIRDDNSESMQKYFKESFDKIDGFLAEDKGKVLVHCYMGASRSATIIANFISTKTGTDIADVLDILVEKRPIVNITEKFAKDLIVEKSI